MADVIERLVAARHRKGWSQTEAADAAGVKVDSLRAHEQGRRAGPRTRKRIADAVGVTLTDEELFGE